MFVWSLIALILTCVNAQRQPGVCPQDCDVVSVCGSGTSADLRFLSCVCTETYLNGFERCASLCLELGGGVTGYDIRTVCAVNGFLPPARASGAQVFLRGTNKAYLPIRGPAPTKTKKPSASTKRPTASGLSPVDSAPPEDEPVEQVELPPSYQPLPGTSSSSGIKSTSQGLSAGAIAGIVVASLVAMGAGIFVAVAMSKRKQQKQRSIESRGPSRAASQSEMRPRSKSVNSMSKSKSSRSRTSCDTYSRSQSTYFDSALDTQSSIDTRFPEGRHYPSQLRTPSHMEIVVQDAANIVSIPVLSFEEAFPDVARASQL